MAKRFFTADFHLSMESILKFENRPFASIAEHDAALLKSCCQRAKAEDVIFHVGDLFCYKQDLHGIDSNSAPNGSQLKPADVISAIPATFINIRGNHDINNHVKSLCESMRIKLSRRFPSVSIGHYPSYSIHAKDQFANGDIRICGHVHRQWKHCLDLDHSVLNINVGVDVWDYQIVSEDELIQYIESIVKLSKDNIVKVRKIDGKPVRV